MASVNLENYSWGIRPVLFNIGNFQVPSYTFFIGLGFLVGLAVYFWETKRAILWRKQSLHNFGRVNWRGNWS